LGVGRAGQGLGDEQRPWLRPGESTVSPANFELPVRKGDMFPDPLTLYDNTLRKILYTPGVSPDVSDMLRVASMVEELGVREVLLNLHWWGEEEPEDKAYKVCQAIFDGDFAFRTCVWVETPLHLPGPARTRVKTATHRLSVARAAGATRVVINLDAPDVGTEYGITIELFEEVIQYGHSLGLEFVASLPNSVGMPIDHAVRLANDAIRLGVVGVQLTDPMSSLRPEAMKAWCGQFKRDLVGSVPLTMHVHNDFGLATALSLAASTSGLNPEVSIGGISYRAGFAALEEVAVALEYLYGVSAGVRLDKLQQAAKLVADVTGLPLHPLKPITGAHAYLRDNPPAMIQEFETPNGFPPPNACVAPTVVGARLSVVWGHHHSNAAIRAKIHQLGLDASDAQVREIRRGIEMAFEALPNSYPRWLEDAEIEKICKSILIG
jgi:isopropylmalate/homocitrate/citramalate synthase